MWKGRRISVIFPTYNEKDSIYEAIQDFFASEYVDEIVVVNNNAAEGTDEEVRKTRARLVHERKQGYGHAIQRGFREVTGDLIVVAEPDGTFEGNDIIKLLAYSDDFEFVLGTRTLSVLIWEEANMGWFLRLGNMCVAKMVEVLFNTTSLSDVGCTMRIISRKALEKIQGQFTVGGSHFGAEMMALAAMNRLSFVEVPVNYKGRVGISSVTGSKVKAFFLGLQMTAMMLRYWVKFIAGLLGARRHLSKAPPSVISENNEGYAWRKPRRRVHAATARKERRIPVAQP